jgi:hypothetical protein
VGAFWPLASVPARHYHLVMTKLLDQAFEAVRRLPADDQDEIARAIMHLAGAGSGYVAPLTAEERQAIARSKAAAQRGEFAEDNEVQAVWKKHGL